ncbi:MAG: hypothetical protein KME23_00950 [Goleter apudmare HA4340-LM2]|nr:hypothetical protein [Goleter apudmare HA4340-LM2]
MRPLPFGHPTAGASLSRHLLQLLEPPEVCRKEHLPGNFSPQRSGSLWEKTGLALLDSFARG